MHKVTGIGTPSAKPDGIPVSELTYGTAVSLAEILFPCVDNKGEIEFGVIADLDSIRDNVRLIVSVMPWGVLAASCIKLCNRLIGFLGNRDDFRLNVWNESKRLIVNNTPSVARVLDIDQQSLGDNIQSFVNESMLTFLVGEDITNVVNPEFLDATEYEYAAIMATLSSALICASATVNGIAPRDMALKLRMELQDIVSNTF